MHLQEIGDWIVRAIVALGVPGLIGKYLYDWRQNRGGRRIQEAEADVEELITPVKVHSASVTGFEAQMIAMERGFAIERKTKDETIEFLTERLVAEQAYSSSRDKIIAELRAEVEGLRNQLDAIASRLKTLDTEGHPGA